MKRFSGFILLFTFILVGCSMVPEQKSGLTGNQQKTQITISAASSLHDVLLEVKDGFEAENNEIEILYNFGGSGGLQQQIIQGAPVDLFFSAAEDKFDELIDKKLIEASDATDLLGNSLTLISRKDSPIQSFNDLKLAEVKSIAIGTPQSVPAGKYAKQTLENLNLWNDLEDKLIFTKDVRQVLTYVETGNVDTGLVYMTDAKDSDKVKVIQLSDPKLHDPIVYPVGIVRSSNYLEETKRFYHYLQGETAKKLFEKYGFTVLE